MIAAAPTSMASNMFPRIFASLVARMERQRNAGTAVPDFIRATSIPKLGHRSALRAAGGDADRAAVERRHEPRVRHLVADFLQQRFDAEIDPAAEARIVV